MAASDVLDRIEHGRHLQEVGFYDRVANVDLRSRDPNRWIFVDVPTSQEDVYLGSLAKLNGKRQPALVTLFGKEAGGRTADGGQTSPAAPASRNL